MIVGKIATAAAISSITAGLYAKKLQATINEVDITDPEVSNEINRAWLCEEVPNLDKFVKKEKKVDLNRQYLCSNMDYEL